MHMFIEGSTEESDSNFFGKLIQKLRKRFERSNLIAAKAARIPEIAAIGGEHKHCGTLAEENGKGLCT